LALKPSSPSITRSASTRTLTAFADCRTANNNYVSGVITIAVECFGPSRWAKHAVKWLFGWNVDRRNYWSFVYAAFVCFRAATLRDTRGVILDLQIYALLEQIYGRLGNKELANKYAALSRVTPVPIKETR
jgi:hypothetical protein